MAMDFYFAKRVQEVTFNNAKMVEWISVCSMKQKSSDPIPSALCCFHRFPSAFLIGHHDIGKKKSGHGEERDANTRSTRPTRRTVSDPSIAHGRNHLSCGGRTAKPGISWCASAVALPLSAPRTRAPSKPDCLGKPPRRHACARRPEPEPTRSSDASFLSSYPSGSSRGQRRPGLRARHLRWPDHDDWQRLRLLHVVRQHQGSRRRARGERRGDALRLLRRDLRH